MAISLISNPFVILKFALILFCASKLVASFPESSPSFFSNKSILVVISGNFHSRPDLDILFTLTINTDETDPFFKRSAILNSPMAIVSKPTLD